MSRKLFGILLVLTAVAGLVLLILPGDSDKAEPGSPTLLLPDLAASVNTLQRVQIVASGADPAVTLNRQQDRWVVEQAENYPADWDAVRSALASLAQAKILERKTSNPEYYDRLGVEDLDVPEAQGVMIRFAEASGLPAVIIGNPAQGREGQYARLSGSAESVLLDREIELSEDLSDWLERRIVDVASDEVVEVAVIHPDGEKIRLTKVSADDSDFSLMDIPQGKEIKSNWTVNSLAGVFNALNLEHVAKRPETLPESAVQYRLITADGLQVDAHWYEQGGEEDRHAWLVLSASVFDESAASETHERVSDINQRVEGWAYRVSDYTFDSATKRLEDLVQDSQAVAETSDSGS